MSLIVVVDINDSCVVVLLYGSVEISYRGMRVVYIYMYMYICAVLYAHTCTYIVCGETRCVQLYAIPLIQPRVLLSPAYGGAWLQR